MMGATQPFAQLSATLAPMNVTAIRDSLGVGVAVIALGWVVYSTGYSNGAASKPQVEPQYERYLLDYQGRRSDRDELSARIGAGWAVESANGNPESEIFYVLRKPRP